MRFPQLPGSDNFHGVIYMLVGILFMSLTDAFAKLLVEANYSVLQMLAIRGLFLMVPLTAWMIWRGGTKRIRTNRKGMHVIRAIFGVLAPLLFYLSLKELPLATATVIFFVSPFIMTALSVPLFGEKVGIYRWSAIVVGFSGVLIVMQPGGGMLKWEALLVLGSSLCYCGIMLTGRVLTRTETTLAVVFYNTLGVLIITAFITLFTWEPMPLRDIGLIALMAALSLVSSVCMIRSFAVGEVAVITPFEYTGIIWSVILGFLFFGDFPPSHVWLGIVVIAGSGLFMIYREHIKRV
ncbi:DMT family transporter [Sneathiella sp.]|uniref:DMT family transporter n=1 Tax=Sneathiella sp. TaxID=1964365 RepID=UPI002FE2CAA9